MNKKFCSIPHPGMKRCRFWNGRLKQAQLRAVGGSLFVSLLHDTISLASRSANEGICVCALTLSMQRSARVAFRQLASAGNGG
jgi:hypothetical protein